MEKLKLETIHMDSSKRYKVFDSESNFIQSFKTYKEANTFKFIYGNFSWFIK